MGRGSLEDGSPQRSRGGGPSPRRSQIYEDSLQLSNAFYRAMHVVLARYCYRGLMLAIACGFLVYVGLLPNTSSIFPYPQKTSDLRQSHDPTRPGQDGHRAHPWLRPARHMAAHKSKKMGVGRPNSLCRLCHSLQHLHLLAVIYTSKLLVTKRQSDKKRKKNNYST